MPEQSPATALDPEFEALLRDCLGDVIGPDEVLRADTDLAVYGIESLTIVRLLVTMEDNFGVSIPDDVIGFEIFSSPGALWRVVSSLMVESHGR